MTGRRRRLRAIDIRLLCWNYHGFSLSPAIFSLGLYDLLFACHTLSVGGECQRWQPSTRTGPLLRPARQAPIVRELRRVLTKGHHRAQPRPQAVTSNCRPAGGQPTGSKPAKKTALTIAVSFPHLAVPDTPICFFYDLAVRGISLGQNSLRVSPDYASRPSPPAQPQTVQHTPTTCTAHAVNECPFGQLQLGLCWCFAFSALF